MHSKGSHARTHFIDSDELCGFQSLHPCAIASLRSSDLMQDCQVEGDAPAFFHIRGKLTLVTIENMRTKAFPNHFIFPHHGHFLFGVLEKYLRVHLGFSHCTRSL